jgi:hypothetical protein
MKKKTIRRIGYNIFNPERLKLAEQLLKTDSEKGVLFRSIARYIEGNHAVAILHPAPPRKKIQVAKRLIEYFERTEEYERCAFLHSFMKSMHLMETVMTIIKENERNEMSHDH